MLCIRAPLLLHRLDYAFKFGDFFAVTPNSHRNRHPPGRPDHHPHSRRCRPIRRPHSRRGIRHHTALLHPRREFDPEPSAVNPLRPLQRLPRIINPAVPFSSSSIFQYHKKRKSLSCFFIGRKIAIIFRPALFQHIPNHFQFLLYFVFAVSH